MSKTDFIQLQRFERQCGHNADLRRLGKTRGIFYDFRVIINGEHRADLVKTGYSTGYNLVEPERLTFGQHPITDPRTSGYHQRSIHITSQGVALHELHLVLDAGYIPTLEELERRRRDRKKAARAEALKDRHRERIARIHGAAPKLLAALSRLCKASRAGNLSAGELRNAEDLIADLRKLPEREEEES